MGYIRARTVTAGTTDTAMFGTRATGGNSTRVGFPIAGSIGQGTITAPAAPGVGKSHAMSIKDSGGTTQGTAVTLSDANQSVRSTITATIPLFDSVTPTNAVRYIRRDDSGGPPSQAIEFLFEYSITGEPRMCYVGFGDNSQGFTSTTTNKFQSFENNGADVSTTEADHQCAWPKAGTLGPFLFSWTLTGTSSTTEVALRINGADVLVQSLPGQASSAQQVTFNDNRVSIARNDLVNLRILRTGTVDGSMTLAVVCGFKT